MGIYGEKIDNQEIRPFAELCRFADQSELRVELDKPFVEFDNLILRIISEEDDKEIARIVLDDISSLDSKSAKILNNLSRGNENC